MTTTTAAPSPVMSAQEVADLVGVSKRSIERAAENPKTPYYAARLRDGIEKLRFRRDEIERLVLGPVADVVPMKKGGAR